MKKLITSLVIIFLVSMTAMAQNETADSVANMLKNGDSNGISGLFMNNVDLTILDTDDVYSKTQATQVTKRFFSDHAPTGFEIKHQGKSKLDDHYRIGTLSTSNGEFRVTYFLKNHEGKYLIKQLRIEANDRGF